MRGPCRLAAVGLSCSLGSRPGDVWGRLFDASAEPLSLRDDLVRGKSRHFAQVTDSLPEIPSGLERYGCRNNRIALRAYEAIRPAVDAAIERYGAHRVGVVAGSSTAGVAEAEAAVLEWRRSGTLPEGFDLLQLEYGGVSEFLSEVGGLGGPSYALSTACSTGAKALASARRLLDMNLCDAVVAGAVDSLCALTANGFEGLKALSPERTNPMSANRAGLNLGEGGALFLVTREPGGISLAGVGESSDAHHISAPDPAGVGAEASMQAALDDASISSEQIAYLNLHGTGTRQNDQMESIAVDRVFRASPPCSSTKPLLGHTLGAAGALEAALCWLMLENCVDGTMRVPPHRYDGIRDEGLPSLDLVGDGDMVAVEGATYVMSNSFGFGGSNCTLILRSDG